MCDRGDFNTSVQDTVIRRNMQLEGAPMNPNFNYNRGSPLPPHSMPPQNSYQVALSSFQANNNSRRLQECQDHVSGQYHAPAPHLTQRMYNDDHHMMTGGPQHQQMNHQHAHQMYNTPTSAAPPSNHQHHYSGQQMMPYGMHLNTNNNAGTGNNGTYPGFQVNPNQFHSYSYPSRFPNNQNQQPQFYMPRPNHQTPTAMCNDHRANLNPVMWRGMVPSIVPPVNPRPAYLPHFPTGPKSTTTPTPILNPMVLDPTALPGGMEPIWREVPQDYHGLITSQDIPDSARSRGYFTVGELLTLKRSLMARGKCTNVTTFARLPPPPTTSKSGGSEGKKESDEQICNKGTNSVPPNDSASGDAISQASFESLREICGISEERLNALREMNSTLEETVTPVITGVRTCETENEFFEQAGEQSSDQNPKTEAIDNMENNPQIAESTDESDKVMTLESDELTEDEQETAVTTHDQQGDYDEPPQQPPTEAIPAFSTVLAEIFSERVSPSGALGNASTSNASAQMSNDDMSNTNDEEQEISLAVSSIVGESSATQSNCIPTTVHINTTVPPSTSLMSCETRYAGPSPPYRTAMLVLKLLQIGPYHIRSFSSVNPNRFRVMFSAQRMAYELFLPIIPNNGTQAALRMRKILTVDIAFDQISRIRFGPDTLHLMIEGPPLLTLTNSPAEEETIPQTMTSYDEFLLEQIEGGQLKLSPCHQLFFLNERLVKTLKAQLKEHPKLRHVIVDYPCAGDECGPHKKMRMF